ESDNVHTAATRPLGEVSHVASNLGPFGRERINGFAFANSEVVGEATRVGLERPRCQAEVRLHLQPGNRVRALLEDGPALSEKRKAYRHPQYPPNPQTRVPPPRPHLPREDYGGWASPQITGIFPIT